MSYDQRETTIVSDLILLHETKSAILVRDFMDAEVWIPKSQILDVTYGKDLVDEKTSRPVKEITSIEIPVWIAEDKGLA